MFIFYEIAKGISNNKEEKRGQQEPWHRPWEGEKKEGVVSFMRMEKDKILYLSTI